MTYDMLLLTFSQDFFTIDRVQQCLIDSGYRTLRIDTDQFPQNFSLNTRIEQDHIRHYLQAGGREVCLDHAQAIWCRNLWPAVSTPLSGRAAQRAYTDSRIALFDTLSNLDGPSILDTPENQLFAHSKIRQLHQAKKIGLPIPATLISNDLNVVNHFSQTQGALITKTLSAYLTLGKLADDFAFTERVEDISPEKFSAVRYHPQIFQQEIAKHKEFRVILVGQEIYIASLSIDKARNLPVDWRRAQCHEAGIWAVDELPDALITKLRALMHALRLNYCAIDLLQDSQGQYYFLELNPSGEYGWLERDLDLPISASIARRLMGSNPPVQPDGQ